MIQDRTNNTQQFNALAGTTSRITEVDSLGNFTATKDIVVGKLSNATTIALLIDNANWNNLGVYIGTAITETYEGMYYFAGNYYYVAYSDNVWIRLPVISNNNSVSLVDSNESEGAGSYIDLVAGKSGRGSIVFGDGLGYADFIFTTAGVVTLLAQCSANVFTTLQTGTNHVVIKDNGANVRVVNELGSTQTFTLTVNYTN